MLERSSGKMDDDRIVSLYECCLEQERHFNLLQSGYRKLSSTWLLGNFAAIGFLLNSDDIARTISPTLAIVFVGMMSSIGIAMLWALDLLVYHRLLNANFAEAFRLETDHLWLPRTHYNMYYDALTHGYLPRVVLFYILGVCVPLVVSLAFLISFVQQFGLMSQIITCTLGAVLVVAISNLIWRATTPARESIGQFVFRSEDVRKQVLELARAREESL